MSTIFASPPRGSCCTAIAREGDWAAYERGFLGLMRSRSIETALDPSAFGTLSALLCSEPTARRCHRRLVCEHLARHWSDVRATHL